MNFVTLSKDEINRIHEFYGAYICNGVRKGSVCIIDKRRRKRNGRDPIGLRGDAWRTSSQHWYVSASYLIKHAQFITREEWKELHLRPTFRKATQRDGLLPDEITTSISASDGRVVNSGDTILVQGWGESCLVPAIYIKGGYNRRAEEETREGGKDFQLIALNLLTGKEEEFRCFDDSPIYLLEISQDILDFLKVSNYNMAMNSFKLKLEVA